MAVTESETQVVAEIGEVRQAIDRELAVRRWP